MRRRWDAYFDKRCPLAEGEIYTPKQAAQLYADMSRKLAQKGLTPKSVLEAHRVSLQRREVTLAEILQKAEIAQKQLIQYVSHHFWQAAAALLTIPSSTSSPRSTTCTR